MNKTVNINLAGLFFHIDEEAYLKLQRYLNAIKRSFTDSQGRSEIVSDIEARIAELFTERVKTSNQVIGSKEVDEVITIMGQPEDYLVDDDIFEDEPQSTQKRSSSIKKLFRDTENSYVSGVSSGLGHYLGINAIWIRLIWLLLIFGLGTGILIYILLWIFVPEAKTTTDKLQMTGDPINISNIEKKIRDGFDGVSENLKNVDFQKHGDKFKEGFDNVTDAVSSSVKNVKDNSNLKATTTSFFDGISDIVMFFVKLFAKFIGVILMITGISMFIGTAVSVLTLGIADGINMPGLDFLDLSYNAGIPIWLISLIVFLFVGIMGFFIFYLGLKIVVNNLKSIGRPAKFGLLGIWLLSLIALIYLGINQGMSYQEKATITTSETLYNITKNDTLNVAMVYNENYTERFTRRNGISHVINEFDERELYSQNIRLNIKPTRDSIAKIKVVNSARGFDYDTAKLRAENINYNYIINDKELLLNNYFLITNNATPKDQKVEVTLYLPVGTTIYLDENTYEYNYLSSNKDEQFLIMDKNELICNDCDNKDDNDEDFEIDVNINGEKGKLIINSDGIKTQKDNLELVIDSSGVKSNSTNLKINIGDGKLEIKDNN
ncbi:PspC domain-containing protein [Aurantibacter sp.]|uniref:PspC domain-containing protein n=1 Tax=Aurantibacter sp. TaxID=2807103 RepID=UPI0035C85096